MKIQLNSLTDQPKCGIPRNVPTAQLKLDHLFFGCYWYLSDLCSRPSWERDTSCPTVQMDRSLLWRTGTEAWYLACSRNELWGFNKSWIWHILRLSLDQNIKVIVSVHEVNLQVWAYYNRCVDIGICQLPLLFFCSMSFAVRICGFPRAVWTASRHRTLRWPHLAGPKKGLCRWTNVERRKPKLQTFFDMFKKTLLPERKLEKAIEGHSTEL